MVKKESNVDQVIKLLSLMRDSIVPDKDIVIKLEKDLEGSLQAIKKIEEICGDIYEVIRKLDDRIKKLEDDLKEVKDSEKKFKYLMYFLVAISTVLPILLKVFHK